jgi:hypothetical protein
MADRRDALVKQFVAKFNPRDRGKRTPKPVKVSKRDDKARR